MSSDTYLVYQFRCKICGIWFRWQHRCKSSFKLYRRDKFGEIDFSEIETIRTKKPLPKNE